MRRAADVTAEQKRLHPYIVPDEHEPIVTLIMPGRRALGEQWTKLTIGQQNGEMTYDTAPSERPADGKAIMAVAGADAEYARYIVEAQMEKAQERAVAPQELTAEERFEALNMAWQDFCEQKLRAFKGQTTIGPGGMSQRESAR